MKAKNKILLIIILIFIITISFFISKDGSPSVSNITISYADSLFVPNEAGLTKLPSNFIIELRYATTNNFAKTQFYPKIAKAYLQESTAQKLVAANEDLYKLGYRIKIFDAYRPNRYQYALRDVAEEINPATKGYIADPKTGSHHNRGTSVDITLTDLSGREVNMPTSYDHFGPEASISYNGCTNEQKENRELLGTIMEKHGFRRISSEWWHFDDVDFNDYPLLDVDFIDLYE